MSQSVAILGRQPALGLAELESLYGADKLRPAGPLAVLLDVNPDEVDFRRLGGSIKLARLLTRLETTDWNKIEQHLRKNMPQYLQHVPEGKLKLGLSVYGFDISIAKLNASGLTLKKTIRNTGRSVRIVPNKELELNSAQVLHNGLTTPTGYELLVIRDGNGTLLARTAHEQNIDAYAARDQSRPKRDARVGMLPPKLAQTIINLAAADASPNQGVVLDPFCGTGVVLQEALLMGFGIYGTDVEPRMVDYSTKNLEWLDANYELANPIHKLEVGDATSHQWNPAPHIVACEGYLGQPFATFPPAQKLAEVRNTCNLILRKFLQNIGSQLKPGSRLCLAVPAWQQIPGTFIHLPTLDHLEEMGYNRMSFEHVRDEDLVYARADQIVARELLVLTKK
jgi:tRNA G10  N-methylase Trm11